MNNSAYRCVPNWFDCWVVNTAVELGLDRRADIDGSNTITFEPSDPPPCRPPACVVAVAVFDAAETLPAASVALTVYVYCVDAVRPVSVYDVVGRRADRVPLRKIW